MVLRLKGIRRASIRSLSHLYLPIRVGKGPFDALSLAQGLSPSLRHENSKQMFLVGLPVITLA
jgi:hypothetical protein